MRQPTEPVGHNSMAKQAMNKALHQTCSSLAHSPSENEEGFSGLQSLLQILKGSYFWLFASIPRYRLNISSSEQSHRGHPLCRHWLF
jgi:hypothetical protein